jgi:hypothetical protein
MRRTILIVVLILGGSAGFLPAEAAGREGISFPPPPASYHDAGNGSLGAVLVHRIRAEPFNLVATTIFLLAIIHTFFAPHLSRASHRLHPGFMAEIVHFLGEIEVIFALWVAPLALALWIDEGSAVVWHYFRNVRFTEPLFIVVIIAIAATRPIVRATENLLARVAGDSPRRWWFTLLTVGPLFGSLITEPAAMTICAVLLGKEFYRLGPSKRFMYATLGLLFVNVSVGGALTNFAAPPVLMVAAKWNWSTAYLLQQFGVRAVAGMVVGNLLYFAIFRGEFARLAQRRSELPGEDAAARNKVPWWITCVHLAFLVWTVWVAHEPGLFILGFLAFVGFVFVTRDEQETLNLRPPLFVGLFLAGLVIHGGLQGWWIEPLLGRMDRTALLLGATVLTAFNDNAAITYLATLVPSLTEPLKDAVVSGAICGGGLTVIANAPNLAGQSILQRYFPEGSISPGGLFLAALGPTVVMVGIFMLPG